MLRNAMLVAGVLGLAACPVPLGGIDGGAGGGSGGGAAGGSGGSGGGAGGGAGVGGGAGGGSATFAASAKGLVRFKRNERINADFAKSLGLTQVAVCNELGLYPCTIVHQLALGGVDPYNIGLYEPVAFTGLTSPLVVDRMALGACIQRVTADLATPTTALIFRGLALDASGKLVNVNAPEVKTALDLLYKQVLLRPVTDAEVGHLTGLYADVLATNKPEAAKSWMTLSCFAVLTSVESVFY
ncbi:MAG: hypothetical protein H6Q89_4269 [Myxococcaceae bacterium]|nr:hypothetical protein [Myxococcaceae bacterium]